LKVLKIEYGFGFLDGVDDEAIIELAEGCRELEILHLWHCDKLTDAAFDKLGECCPLLRVVKGCEGSPLLTLKALKRLLKRINSR
jgi:hypothetical protein